jgi:hypothetical protein
MKKLITMALMILILFAATAHSETVYSSGLTTSDRLIATGNCYYHGMAIVSGASTATVSVYDGITATGTTIDKGNCPTASGACRHHLPAAVEVFNGIYADVTGTGAAYTIFYKCGE